MSSPLTDGQEVHRLSPLEFKENENFLPAEITLSEDFACVISEHGGQEAHQIWLTREETINLAVFLVNRLNLHWSNDGSTAMTAQ